MSGGGSPLVARLAARAAAAGGLLAFSDYMQCALLEPGLGYYDRGAEPFGPAGDFVTAPESGALYARALARAVLPVLAADPAAGLLECGPGTGALAAGLLQALDALGKRPPALVLVEPSATLVQRQAALLLPLARRLGVAVEWRAALPDRFRGVVLANEVIDALPVELFEMTSAGPMERVVRFAGEQREWGLRTPTAGLAAELARLLPRLPAPLPEGYRSEVRPAARTFAAEVARMLECGLWLVVDYGYSRREYYLPERCEGTLRTWRGHQPGEDPLDRPGECDLTAHVDFSTLAEAAVEAGLELLGHTTQAHFLIGNGILDDLSAAGPGSGLAHEARRLLLPGGMGERFRVMALGRGPLPAMAGFDGPDLTDRL